VPVGEQPAAELTVGVIVRQDVRQVAGQRRDIDAGYLGGRAAAGRVGQFPVVLEEHPDVAAVRFHQPEDVGHRAEQQVGGGQAEPFPLVLDSPSPPHPRRSSAVRPMNSS